MTVIELTAIEAGPYPSLRLPVGGTGLCLFAAAFLGAQDAIHMHRAGMELDLVDTDGDRLREMGDLYPLARRHVQDAWAFADDARGLGYMWDVVSVDSWTGEIESRVMGSLGLWCSLADRMVTVTHTRTAGYVIPDGWTGRIMRRSPLANWLVLTR